MAAGSFEGLPHQELGDDFVFESDSRSLKQILGHQELTPKILLPSSGLKPVRMTPNSAAAAAGGKLAAPQHLGQGLEPFRTKSGVVLYRQQITDKGGAEMSTRKRGLGRALATSAGLVPKRMTPSSNSGRQRQLAASEMAAAAACRTERKHPTQLHPAIHRQSISERKVVPMIDGPCNGRGGGAGSRLRSLLPKPVKPSARKELNFEEGCSNQHDFEFAKPKDLPLPAAAPKQQPPPPPAEQRLAPGGGGRSLAQMIMMRESLAGMPRASLTGLFRQSLSMAELDRMFEDDSTESFENLESRLKTPAKKKKPESIKPVSAPVTAAPVASSPSMPPIKRLSPPLAHQSPAQSIANQEPHPPHAEVITEEGDAPTSPSGNQCDDQSGNQPGSQSGNQSGNQSVNQQSDNPSVMGECGSGNYSLYEIDIEDANFEDANNASVLLQKARSYEDLRPSVELDADEVVLAGSNSEEDLRRLIETRRAELPKPELQLETSDPFLKEAIDNLNRHRQEMADSENHFFEVMTKRSKRRKEFKAIWGFSPRTINQKRDRKVVLNVQRFEMSEDSQNDDAEKKPDFVDGDKEQKDCCKIPEGNDDKEDVIKTASVDADPAIETFDGSEDAEGDDEEKEEEEELNVSISADLFRQLVDANLDPTKADELHNFSGIDLLEPATMAQPPPPSFSLDEIAEVLEADFLHTSNAAAAKSNSVKTNEKIGSESYQSLDMEIEDDDDKENTAAKSFEEQDTLELCGLEGTTESVEMELEDDFNPFASETIKKGTTNKKSHRKSVRFLNATPEKSAGRCGQEKITPSVQIEIPVKLSDNSQANISVNESRLCLTGSLKNTPLPNRNRRTAVDERMGGVRGGME